MNSYLPLLTPENTTKPIFSSEDFSYIYGYATLADLLNYANLYETNNFFGFNNFISLSFTGTINNISTQVFGFIKNLTSDAQSQFNTIYTRLTNYSYYSDTNTQNINNNTSLNGIISSFQINTNIVITDTILNNNLTSNNVNCNILRCNSIYGINCPVAYIYNQNVPYPIIKSGLISNLTQIDLTKPVYVSIAPNYEIMFLSSSNLILASLSNPSTDYIHYQGINFSSYNIPTSYKILNII